MLITTSQKRDFLERRSYLERLLWILGTGGILLTAISWMVHVSIVAGKARSSGGSRSLEGTTLVLPFLFVASYELLITAEHKAVRRQVWLEMCAKGRCAC